jgi:hypothetical protein
MFDIGATKVALTLHVPLTELELAFGHNISQNPEGTMANWGPELRRYFGQHIRVTAKNKEPWALRVGEIEVRRAEQTQSGPFQELTVRLLLTPPNGASPRSFTLHYDAILHQVVTHRVLVSIQRDWAGGKAEPTPVGLIAVDTGTAKVAPFEIDLGEGGWWEGLRGMFRLGAQHIREGTDHLLFLLVLLLPSTLLVQGGRWGEYGGPRYGLLRLVRIVTAFTIGHSVTLLAGALQWLTLPQQPVEVLIAASILVTAVHAVRPLFAGHEAAVAAGFGLVHGLAFATVLTEMHLEPGAMVLSILGFNLGIEVMQLFIVGLTAPWLLLLSQTPAHRWVRVVGAGLAGLAAMGWMVGRITGETNGLERVMNVAGAYAPVGILLLAMVTIPAALWARRADFAMERGND